MSKYVYNVNSRIHLLTDSKYCEGGQCVHMNHRECVCNNSTYCGTAAYTRCSEFKADHPHRNAAKAPGQCCGNCRFYFVGKCRCWKSFSTRRYSVTKHDGRQCGFWQKERKPEKENS